MAGQVTAPMSRPLDNPVRNDAEVLRELARVKVLFQLRAITAVLGAPHTLRSAPRASAPAGEAVTPDLSGLSLDHAVHVAANTNRNG